MGLYTTLDDIQVKCFFSANYAISRNSEELNDVTLSFNSSGGKLNYYSFGDIVPYCSPYYNYGKNFAIYIFTHLSDYEEPTMIFVRGGRLHSIKTYNEIAPEDIEGIPLYINNFGDVLNISDFKDIKNIVIEFRNAYKEYIRLSKQYSEELFGENISIDKIYKKVRDGEISTEEFIKIIQQYEKIQEKAHQNTLKLVNEKWKFSEETENFQKVHKEYETGFIFDNLISREVPEWHKYKCVELYKEHLKKNNKDIFKTIEQYIEWANKTDLKYTANFIMTTFKKYGEKVPQDVIQEYLSSEIYKNEVFFCKK